MLFAASERISEGTELMHSSRGEGFQSELTVFMQFWLNFKKSLNGGYSDIHMMSH